MSSLYFGVITWISLFVLQEPKSDKDADLCSKVNEYLNNPPTPGSNRTGGSGILPQELTSGLCKYNLIRSTHCTTHRSVGPLESCTTV